MNTSQLHGFRTPFHQCASPSHGEQTCRFGHADSQLILDKHMPDSLTTSTLETEESHGADLSSLAPLMCRQFPSSAPRCDPARPVVFLLLPACADPPLTSYVTCSFSLETRPLCACTLPSSPSGKTGPATKKQPYTAC